MATTARPMTGRWRARRRALGEPGLGRDRRPDRPGRLADDHARDRPAAGRHRDGTRPTPRTRPASISAPSPASDRAALRLFPVLPIEASPAAATLCRAPRAWAAAGALPRRFTEDGASHALPRNGPVRVPRGGKYPRLAGRGQACRRTANRCSFEGRHADPDHQRRRHPAPGLVVAEAIAREIAGRRARSGVVAPAFEQSGVSHCVSYIRPMRLEQLEGAALVEGSPADCVLAGLYEILGRHAARPDPVRRQSRPQCRRGHASFRHDRRGARRRAAWAPRDRDVAILRPPRRALGDPFSARAHGAAVVRRIFDGADWSPRPHAGFCNVNFLPVAAEAVRGLRHGPGPPARHHVRRAAADRAERAPVPLADPWPRQCRCRARSDARVTAMTAISP